MITDSEGRVLLLKSAYGDLTWHLPGGAIDPGETIQDCVERECWEELGQKINVLCLTGVYYHKVHTLCIYLSGGALLRANRAQSEALTSDTSRWKNWVRSSGSEWKIVCNSRERSPVRSSDGPHPSLQRRRDGTLRSTDPLSKPTSYPTSVKGVLVVWGGYC